MSEYQKINLTRFLLMVPVCIISFGVPIPYGAMIRVLCGSASIAFYIFAGFLISRARSAQEQEQRMVRAIRHTAVLAAVILTMYLAVNALYFRLMGASLLEELQYAARSKRFWFEFLVMNIWHLPVGENFWFIQSLLYGYIALYLLQKLKLLRFDWLIFLACMTFTVLAGELAGVVNFSLLGYGYIPANVITRALPYMLLGRMLRRARAGVADRMERSGEREPRFDLGLALYDAQESLLERLPYNMRRNIRPIMLPSFGGSSMKSSYVALWLGPLVFLLLVPLGGLTTFGEVYLLEMAGKLVYTGHFIGNGIMAVGLCMAVIQLEYEVGSNPPRNFFERSLRGYTTFIYAVHQPLSFLLLFGISMVMPQLLNYVGPWQAFVVFALALLLAVPCNLLWDWLRGLVQNLLWRKSKAKDEEEDEPAEA